MPDLDVAALEELADLAAFEELFERTNTPHNRMRICGGAGDRHAIRFNREAFEHLELVPGVPLAPEAVSLEATILGEPVSCPILIGPSSGHGTVHAEGAPASYRAASHERVVMGLSVFNRAYEEVAAAADGPLWFQVFPEQVHKDLDRARAAIAAGSPGLILTVDSSFHSRGDTWARESALPEPDLGARLKAPLRDLRDWLFDFEPESPKPENPYNLLYRSAWATWCTAAISCPNSPA